MSHALFRELGQLVNDREWTVIVAREPEFLTITDPQKDRAQSLYWLSYARWKSGRNALDIAAAIRHSRAAVRLDPSHGKALYWLGKNLVTIGNAREGRRYLHEWISRLHEWPAEVKALLGDAQYSLGYAARYEGDCRQAALWYAAAVDTYTSTMASQARQDIARCALAQTHARMNNPAPGRAILAGVPEGGPCEGYRLKALTHVLAAEGRLHDALLIGNRASEELDALGDDDPWDLAELHLLMACLQDQVGNTQETSNHLSLAMEFMAVSPRNDLYAAARLLLETDAEEVKAS